VTLQIFNYSGSKFWPNFWTKKNIRWLAALDIYQLLLPLLSQHQLPEFEYSKGERTDGFFEASTSFLLKLY